MKNNAFRLIVLCICLFTLRTSATTYYVDINSTNATPPYTNWTTAATDIQSAVNQTTNGDLVLVNPGIYGSSGYAASDGSRTAVIVTNAITIQGLNGQMETLINGSNAMRCIYLGSGASLIGFTLTNGVAGEGAGVYCFSTNAEIMNCTMVSNTATTGAGAYSGTITNCALSNNRCPATGGNGAGAANSWLYGCTISGNLTGSPTGSGASWGTGVSGSVLYNCTVSGNSAYGAGAQGGGAYNSTLNNCIISGNYSDAIAGGAANCNSTNCTFSSNSALEGGGVSGGTLVNCVISGNYCLGGDGGGVYWTTTLYNCLIVGNYASYGGGGDACTMNNCTVTGNSANTIYPSGGAAYYCTLNNCIVYGNNDPTSPIVSSSLNYCCSPISGGTGCITNNPLFGSGYQLQSSSPCINAGNNAYVATPLDLAGNLRIAAGIVDMGAYEFQTSNPLTVAIQASLTNVPVEYPVNFTSVISKGQSDSWNFGDGTIISNRLSVAHTWTTPGTYPVVLTVYDVSAPNGISATVTVNVKTQIVYYVSQTSQNPISPYSSWSTAATNIQNAIDAALPVPQSLVLVTNGIYQTGGETINGNTLTNRIVINKTITVQSANGSAVTVIQGYQVPGATNGNNAVRCVYMTNDATLIGFTLTGGATQDSGDAIHDESGAGVWCESATAAISNCVITGNSAIVQGGGVYGGMLFNSTICSNNANFTADSGDGGGASSSILDNCLLYDNLSGSAGGGASGSTLNACSLLNNQAAQTGGGADSSTLNNCTLTDNNSQTGGGANSCTLNNCIIYYNSAPSGPNYFGGTINYCCTLPSPGDGNGNITNAPELTDSSHISAGSPCRGSGSTNYISGTDIDGQPWLNPPSIGCDEFYGGTLTGTPSVNGQLAYTNVAAGFTINCSGSILGHASVCIWNFGDGTTATNQISASHAWRSGGTYLVLLTAYNDSYLNGISATNSVYVPNQPAYYVSLSSSDPLPPYTSWATASTNVQNAIDAAAAGGTILVTNGLYEFGGRVVYGFLTNRIAVTKPLTLQSINGPGVTIIQGYQVPGTTNDDGAVRCIYLTNDSKLSGFTLINGATRAAGDAALEQSGGGVFCADNSVVVSNCILTADAAAYGGGAAYQGTFFNCLFLGNWALNEESEFLQGGGGAALQSTLNNSVLSNNWVVANNGGGASYCVLSNCTLIGNSAYYGGGASYSTLNNCLLSSNDAEGSGGAVTGGILTNCTLQFNSSWMGGAAYSATLNNCLVISNSAGYLGGGGESSAFSDCTVVGNSSSGTGGGVSYSGPINNCVVYYNTATSGGPNTAGDDINNTCTTADSTSAGTGNITNEPIFVAANAGDFHLQSNSPCINSGNNAYISTPTDLDGNPRVVGGTVDIGAYEYQTPTSVISYAYLQQYGLPTDGSVDFKDLDGTSFNVYQDWIAGLNPTNSASVLAMLTPVTTNSATGVTVTWQSVSGIPYLVQRSTNLISQPPFSTIQSNITGQPNTTSFIDTTATNNVPYFYRVGVIAP